jgi:hypothetical protein
MNTYEIVLVCPFCDTENRLGTVQASSAYQAKQEAEVRWPDARYEEIVARRLREESSSVPVEMSL